MKGNRENRPMDLRELQAILPETDEDHLGVALIQPGSFRYEQMRWQIFSRKCLQQGWNRVTYVPCNSDIARDFLMQCKVWHWRNKIYIYKMKWRQKNENHTERWLREGVRREQKRI